MRSSYLLMYDRPALSISVALTISILLLLLLLLQIVYFTKSASEGAQTQIYLSASKNIGLSDAGD